MTREGGEDRWHSRFSTESHLTPHALPCHTSAVTLALAGGGGKERKEVEKGYDDMRASERRGYSHSIVRCWWERLYSLKLHVFSREGFMEGGSYTLCARPPVQLPDDADHIPIKKSQNAPDCNENIPIYNYVSGPNTLTFQENTDVVIERILEVPSAQAIWYPWGLPFRSVFWYRVFAIFVHVIPGALLDIAFVIKGNPPMAILLEIHATFPSFHPQESLYNNRPAPSPTNTLLTPTQFPGKTRTGILRLYYNKNIICRSHNNIFIQYAPRYLAT
uniref:Uncharacterized protein n=1 Tax=Timema shepardi TaxID=629360 RepID=A0A7R9G3Q6_TIMSH|nr:unnamed protein product [Timema shepardi]